MTEIIGKEAASTQAAPEPWLRGTHLEVPAVLRAVLHALELTREDVHHWTAELTESDLHAAPSGLNSIAVQLRHIPGSLDRLLTCAEGGQLSAEQLAALKSEGEGGGGSREELLAELDRGLDEASRRVRALAGADMEQARAVGRKQLPTSVGGLVVHVADHTQRHVGQIVTTAKVLKAGKPRGVSGLL
jgi:uncharacterized damage-inducible protein DinB